MHQVTHCPLQTTHRQRDKNNSRRRVSTQGLLSFIQVVFGTEPLNRALFVLYEKFQQHCQQAVKCRKLYWLTGKYIQTGFLPRIRICAHEVKIFVTALYKPTLCPCLLPSLWKFTARHIWTLTTVTHSAQQCSAILELVLLVVLISAVFFN